MMIVLYQFPADLEKSKLTKLSLLKFKLSLPDATLLDPNAIN